MLTCTTCNISKPTSDFTLLAGRTTMYRKRCNQCTADVEAKLAAEAAQRAQGLQLCSSCSNLLPLDQFTARVGYGRAPGAVKRQCRRCVSENSSRHYLKNRDREMERAAAGKAVRDQVGIRLCGECKRELPLSQFNHDKRSMDGYKRVCVDCGNTATRTWQQENAESEKARHRDRNLKKYGITSEIFEILSAAQGHRCFVCKAHRTELASTFGFHLDHDHKTGMVRSLLCRSCNAALGLVEDSIERLLALAAYLEDFHVLKTPGPGASADNWREFLAGQKELWPSQPEPEEPQEQHTA